MAELRKAILTGTYEASRVHDELRTRDRWEANPGRIDVFAAIDYFRLPLMFRPMEGLLGAYLVDPAPGVLVNIRRPVSVRRYTAAHELGHFRLQHRPSLDGEDLIARTPFAARTGYDEREAEADAFAIAFLLPPWFVLGQMQRHGWKAADMRQPVNVYQLGLRAGVSYEATCYALKNYRVITTATCHELVEITLKTVKQKLVPEYAPPNWHLDVWQLNQRDNGSFVEAAPGDVVDVSLFEHSGGGYLWDVGGVSKSDLELVADRREHLQAEGAVGGHVVRRITAKAKTPGFGSVQLVERRPWEPGVEPLSSYRFSYDISEAGKTGLLEAQLDRMVEEAG